MRAQSLISDMENEGLSAEQAAEVYHIPLDAVLEAAAYVHQNEEFLAAERCRSRQIAIRSRSACDGESDDHRGARADEQ